MTRKKAIKIMMQLPKIDRNTAKNYWDQYKTDAINNCIREYLNNYCKTTDKDSLLLMLKCIKIVSRYGKLKANDNFCKEFLILPMDINNTRWDAISMRFYP